MSKESLMDAISHLDLDLIENYFKEKEANGKKEHIGIGKNIQQ